jgi:ferredoxin--NADP+ reductase
MTDRINEIIKNFNIESTASIQNTLDKIEALENLSQEEKINLSEALSSIFYYHDFSENNEMEKIASRSSKLIGSFGEEVLPFLMEELINADSESAVYLGRCIAYNHVKGVEFILNSWDEHEEDDFASINIIQALSAFKIAEIEQAIPKLIQSTRSNNSHVKSMALNSIGTISLNNSIGKMDEKVRKSMFNAVFSLLSDRKPLVRKNAVSTLGKMHKKGILDREQEGKVHSAFMSMLGKDGKHNWDREFIVRHEIEHFIQLFTAKETLADRYRQSFRILNKRELCHNTFHYEIEAPLIAKKIKAGQFIIVRHNEMSERIPLSVCGWNRDKGSIQIIVNSVGKTSTEINRLNPGNSFTDIVGPLGVRSRVTKYNGTCVVIGGGYGAGAIIPTAHDLRNIGNRVIGVIGARTKNLLLMVDELKAACDEVIITTNDGSEGMTGFVTTALEEILNREKVEHVLAVGPVPMMEAISNMTKPKGIETYVSLNAIMVDGTGMCGACRVSIGNEVKFACIDGPDFNGHLVDFNELMKRQKMFVKHEQEALNALVN